jgi:hypothetical protein
MNPSSSQTSLEMEAKGAELEKVIRNVLKSLDFIYEEKMLGVTETPGNLFAGKNYSSKKMIEILEKTKKTLNEKINISNTSGRVSQSVLDSIEKIDFIRNSLIDKYILYFKHKNIYESIGIDRLRCEIISRCTQEFIDNHNQINDLIDKNSCLTYLNKNVFKVTFFQILNKKDVCIKKFDFKIYEMKNNAERGLWISVCHEFENIAYIMRCIDVSFENILNFLSQRKEETVNAIEKIGLSYEKLFFQYSSNKLNCLNLIVYFFSADVMESYWEKIFSKAIVKNIDILLEKIKKISQCWKVAFDINNEIPFQTRSSYYLHKSTKIPQNYKKYIFEDMLEKLVDIEIEASSILDRIDYAIDSKNVFIDEIFYREKHNIYKDYMQLLKQQIQKCQMVLGDVFFENSVLQSSAASKRFENEELKKAALRYAYRTFYQNVFYESKLSEIQINQPIDLSWINTSSANKDIGGGSRAFSSSSSQRNKTGYYGKKFTAKNPHEIINASVKKIDDLFNKKQENSDRIDLINGQGKAILSELLENTHLLKITREVVKRRTDEITHDFFLLRKKINENIYSLKEEKENLLGYELSGEVIKNKQVLIKTIDDLGKYYFGLIDAIDQYSKEISLLELNWAKKRMLENPSYGLFMELHEAKEISAIKYTISRKKTKRDNDYFDEYQIEIRSFGIVALHVHYKNKTSDDDDITACHLKLLTSEIRGRITNSKIFKELLSIARSYVYQPIVQESSRFGRSSTSSRPIASSRLRQFEELSLY